MEVLGRSRCGGVCDLGSLRRSTLTARRFNVKAFKDDSLSSATGKPGQLQGGSITFRTAGNPPPPAPSSPQASATEAVKKALPSPSSSTPGLSGAIGPNSPLGSSAAAPSPAASGPVPAILAPPQVYEKIAATGGEKAQLPTGKLILLSLLAGMYIAFGGLLMLSVGTCCPGLAATNPGLQRLVQGFIGLPFGLIIVVLCGAELFTGNIAFMTAAFWEKKATFGQLLKNWIVSYIGNFIGTMFIVKLVALTGLAIAGPSAVTISGVKTSLPFMQALTRGILGNWLVCIAVWSATAAGSLPGKVLGIMIPISSFVAMGFEHSVANMFMIPFGIAAGADFTLQHFLSSNLLPVTLGNIIGGALCIATPYAFAYGRKHANVASA